LRTWANEAILVGAQRSATNAVPTSFSKWLYQFHSNPRRRLSASDVLSNYLAGPASSPTPVAIRGQPQNLTVGEGGPAAFRVAAIGTGPVSYQCSRNGSPLADGTNATYTIAAAALGTAGRSSVRGVELRE